MSSQKILCSCMEVKGHGLMGLTSFDTYNSVMDCEGKLSPIFSICYRSIVYNGLTADYLE